MILSHPLSDRCHLLRSFDKLTAGLDASAEGFDAASAKAFRALLKGAGNALDLSKEKRPP